MKSYSSALTSLTNLTLKLKDGIKFEKLSNYEKHATTLLNWALSLFLLFITQTISECIPMRTHNKNV